MLTAELIKEKARALGAAVCGIGKVYEEENPGRDPKMILPRAKAIIGFGFAIPKGLFMAMDESTQYYTYTTLGVKYLDEEYAEIFGEYKKYFKKSHFNIKRKTALQLSANGHQTLARRFIKKKG